MPGLVRKNRKIRLVLVVAMLGLLGLVGYASSPNGFMSTAQRGPSLGSAPLPLRPSNSLGQGAGSTAQDANAPVPVGNGMYVGYSYKNDTSLPARELAKLPVTA